MKIFHGVALLMLLFFTVHVQAQKRTKTYSLSGTITSTDGAPLPNASIYISDLRKGTVADSVGNYILKDIPKGAYLVEVNYTGYKSVVKNFNFNQDITADFQLEVAVIEEKEIVITGVSRATSVKRNPIPITTVSRQFLAQNLSTNAVDAIAAIPGVNAVSTGPNVSKPFIRGLGYNRVLTLFDGIRLEGQQWGDEHGVEIDENAVDRVEVIKGPASLMYGSDAIAGVINFIPRSAPLSGEGRGSASVNYESNNNLMAAAATLQQHINDLSWSVVGSAKMAADYRNKIDGRVYNTGFRQAAAFGTLGLHKRWGYSKLGLSYFDDLQEIPSGKRDSATRKFEKPIPGIDDAFEIVSPKELRSYKIADEHQNVQHFSIYNNSSFALGNGRATTSLGFQKSIRKEFEADDPNEAALFLNLNTLTYDAKYLFHEVGNFSFTGGVNGMYQANRADKGHEFLIPSYHQFDIGPFVYAKISGKKAEWAGGIRYDLRNLTSDALYIKEVNGENIPVYDDDTTGAQKIFSDYSHIFSGLSGSIGFSYQFNKHWSGKVNIARGFRAPNISEISSNGIHSGSKIYQLGNRDFKPEFNFQQDVGVSFNTDHVTINASIFKNRIQNYIYNSKLLNAEGKDSVVVPGFQTFQYTASRAQLWGGEFMIDVHPHPLDWLHFENALSFVNAKNIGANGQKVEKEEMYLPFIPPLHVRSELRANIDQWHSLKNLFAKVTLDVYARQDRIYSLNGTETPTPGYQLVNAGIGADITGKDGHTAFTFSILANNVFDIAYQSNMSRLKYFEDYPNDPRGHSGIYNMGRNISFKVTVPFGLN